MLKLTELMTNIAAMSNLILRLCLHRVTIHEKSVKNADSVIIENEFLTTVSFEGREPVDNYTTCGFKL